MNPGIPLALFDEVASSSSSSSSSLNRNCERRNSSKIVEESGIGDVNFTGNFVSDEIGNANPSSVTLDREMSNSSIVSDVIRETKMAPNVTSAPTGVLYEGETIDGSDEHQSTESYKSEAEYRRRIVWVNVLIFTFLHGASLYGAWLVLTSAKLYTTIFAFILYQCTGLGITAGAHRLWAHRAYKATWQLKIILMIFNTIAFQNTAIEWARDHRVHHKYSETDADPHNAKRGFFFAHVGWLLCKKHPDVRTKGKGIDMSDLEQDPILHFQEKYYGILMPLFCFILPTVIPVYVWGESWSNGFFVSTVLRYVFTLNMTWLVNSAAHLYGSKPYDKFINPAQNKAVALLALGEGWHNYHHVFPWDYKTAELGNYRYNTTTAFIDFFAKIGWAYDLKRVSGDIIRKRVERTGDGTHDVWGWGDKDQPQEERDGAILLYPSNDNEDNGTCMSVKSRAKQLSAEINNSIH